MGRRRSRRRRSWKLLLKDNSVWIHLVDFFEYFFLGMEWGGDGGHVQRENLISHLEFIIYNFCKDC